MPASRSASILSSVTVNLLKPSR
ncbi:hypothetical protein VCHENC02_2475A, partial [Vibrio harveyi]